jgi:hypothetical protein
MREWFRNLPSTVATGVVTAGVVALLGVVIGIFFATSKSGSSDQDPPPRPTVTIDPKSKPAAQTRDMSVSFTWTTTGEVSQTKCSFDRSAPPLCAAPAGRSGLPPGEHSFQVQVKGPGGQASDRYTWTVTAPPPPADVGLSALNNAGDVEFNVDADLNAVNINGTAYNDGVTGSVYPDDSGFSSLTIHAKRRFSKIRFAVGISSDADCPRARARVSLTDESGRTLWGPEVVRIDAPQIDRIPIDHPVQVNLVQRSLEAGENACGNGEATVSWGGVTFSPQQTGP